MSCENEAYDVPVTAEELVRAPRPIQSPATPREGRKTRARFSSANAQGTSNDGFEVRP